MLNVENINEIYKMERLQVTQYNQREENIMKLACKHDINYGLMTYVTYHVQGTLLSDYKIYHMTNNIDEMIDYIKIDIINHIKNKNNINLLFYITDTDPLLVSYQFIISTSQWLKIIIKNQPNICTLHGDKNLYDELYEQLDFLKDYDMYKEEINSLSKKDLKKIYYKTYDRSSILSKKAIYKKLLKNKKMLVLWY
jgi:hypothetical protein